MRIYILVEIMGQTDKCIRSFFTVRLYPLELRDEFTFARTARPSSKAPFRFSRLQLWLKMHCILVKFCKQIRTS